MKRVLVFSNSSDPDGDFRTRWAFAELASTGQIGDFKVVGFGEAGSELRRSFLKNAADQVATVAPDVLIWHKDDGIDLDTGLVEQIASQTRLVYHDLDPWMKWIKPVQRNQKLLASRSRLVFLCGRGSIADLFPEAGNRLRYSPHGYFDIDIPPIVSEKRPHLVFIGSVHRRFARILGRLGLEQHAGRTAAVRALQQRLGERFEAYGKGYPFEWGIKPCPFDEQFDIVNRSLASFAIDAAPDAPGYFSNRTPFSLACGSIHLKIARPGDEVQFHNCPGLIPVRDAEDAATRFEEIASSDRKDLERIANETRSFARSQLRQPDLYQTILRETMEE